MDDLSLDSNWDFDRFNTTSLSAVVQQFHLCALRNDFNEGDEAGEPPTNHWVLSLETSRGSSVTLDMAPGYGSDGLRGKIEVASSEEPRYNTSETLRVFSFPVQQQTAEATVGGLMTFIQSRGRQAFTFSPEWEGCRHWLSVVMSDLDEAAWIPKGSAAVAREALLQYWRNPEGSEPRVMREGAFRS